MEGNVEHAPAELEGLVRVRRSVAGAKSIEYRHWVTRYIKRHGHPPNRRTIAQWIARKEEEERGGSGMNSRKKNKRNNK